MNREAYRNLADSIINQAAKDYLKILKRLKTNPCDKEANAKRMEIESFFMSSWFVVLTDLNPTLLMGKLKNSIEKIDSDN